MQGSVDRVGEVGGERNGKRPKLTKSVVVMSIFPSSAGRGAVQMAIVSSEKQKGVNHSSSNIFHVRECFGCCIEQKTGTAFPTLQQFPETFNRTSCITKHVGALGSFLIVHIQQAILSGDVFFFRFGFFTHVKNPSSLSSAQRHQRSGPPTNPRGNPRHPTRA